MDSLFNEDYDDEEEPEEELPWAMTNRNGADYSQWTDED